MNDCVPKIRVSTMTGKLQGLRAINFSPLSNPFCKASSQKEGCVCSHCYSIHMLKTFRVSCHESWNANYLAMDAGVLEDWEVPRFNKDEKVRLLAHGEMCSDMQALNFVRIAKLNPQAVFTMWTKRPNLFNNYFLPDNFYIIQSSPSMNVKAKEHYFARSKRTVNAVFTVYEDPNDIPDGSYLCKGKKCIECMFCYTLGRETETFPKQIAEIIRKTKSFC